MQLKFVKVDTCMHIKIKFLKETVFLPEPFFVEAFATELYIYLKPSRNLPVYLNIKWREDERKKQTKI